MKYRTIETTPKDVSIPGRTSELKGASTSTAELRRERERAAEEYLARDIVGRLKEGPSGMHAHRNICDAIEEIEWLRASKPDNATTRGELDAITAKLRDMQATIATLLETLERKRSIGEKPKKEGKRR